MILIDGNLVNVPGVQILEPHGEPWNYIARYGQRVHPVQAKILHKTIADDPEKIIETEPHAEHTIRWGRARDTVEYWQEHRNSKTGELEPLSGTHLITGHNGQTVNTADLKRIVGWHANAANDRSWGHEIKEFPGGGVQRQALKAAVAITLVDTVSLGVQWQMPHKYTGPLARWSKAGGADLVGVFGHGDVTSQRSIDDPGLEVFRMLEASGFERFDFAHGQDLETWSKRQEWLRDLGLYDGAIDGVAGAKSRGALEHLGFPSGIFARWRELAELPPMPPGWSRP